MLQDPLFYMMAIPAILIIGISKGGFGGALAVVAVPMLTFAVDPYWPPPFYCLCYAPWI